MMAIKPREMREVSQIALMDKSTTTNSAKWSSPKFILKFKFGQFTKQAKRKKPEYYGKYETPSLEFKQPKSDAELLK